MSVTVITGSGMLKEEYLTCGPEEEVLCAFAPDFAYWSGTEKARIQKIFHSGSAAIRKRGELWQLVLKKRNARIVLGKGFPVCHSDGYGITVYNMFNVPVKLDWIGVDWKKRYRLVLEEILTGSGA